MLIEQTSYLSAAKPVCGCVCVSLGGGGRVGGGRTDNTL